MCKIALSCPNEAVFKQAIREYAIQNGKDIFLKKNDPHRIRVQCKGVGCPWVCFASKIDDTATFVIKTYNDEHKCARKNTNRFPTSRWLNWKNMNEFKMNDKWGISSFMHKVRKENVIEITRDKAYRARLMETRAIEGSYEEQYAALWDYAKEIKWTSRGSTVEFLTEVGENDFNEDCRPVIGLDGCHIKERIRMYMMQRLTKNRHSVIMWESNIAPRIVTVREKNKVEARSHIPTKGSEFMYQVMNMYVGMYSIDLVNWVCSCRRWELTGIPCSHVVASIWHKREDRVTYVSKWYTKEYYMKAYSHQFFPIRNQDEWPRSGKVRMIKPIGKTHPGRPKKSRRVELDELAPQTSKKLKRRYVRMRYLAVVQWATTSELGKDNPLVDPGTYARNSSQPENALVSSTTNMSALQGIMPPPQQVPLNPPQQGSNTVATRTKHG
ncbi:uncharacterized protein LOC133814897 [Humulus lupulus]|uniref:uncharacterized protein LOC133814897 n=1 Tax=Humulus lupulus TaxID=3486 RepID=UPI002B40ABF6|nr:uncharacterized protein LOC133814897 [Humulus lupulus]